MKSKILAVITIMFLAAQMTFAAPFNGNAKTKRMPAGTNLQLKMLNAIDTSTSTAGSGFSAMLLTDQTTEDDANDVILPAGSIVRGDITAIQQPKRMSKGAVLYINFDHVVTPNGRQLPLTLSVTGRADMTYDGGITTTRGYLDAWKQTCSKSGAITKKSIAWGEDVANDSGWKYVTVPVSAVGGAVGTAGYFVYDSAADLIRKGKHVNIAKDEVLNVILVDPIDVPVI